MRFACRQLLILVICLTLATLVSAQDKNLNTKNMFKGENFELLIHGEIYTYDLLEKEKTTIIAVDGVELRVDQMVITAKRIAWYPHTQDLYLEEDIEVKGEKFLFRTSQMTYNLKERKGILKNPTAILHSPEKKTEISNKDIIEIEQDKYLFVTAESAEILKEKFYLTQLRITTNGYAKPFYHLKASQAIYKQGEYIQTWNNILKIGKIPIFYFPYLAKDLQYDWPWFHLSFNQNSRFGYNATLAVKTSFNDQSILVAAKEMELRGLLGTIQYTKINDKTNLTLKAEGIHEVWRGQSKINPLRPDNGFTKSGKDNSIQTREDRYRVHAVYKQDLMWNFSFESEIDRIDAANQFIWKSNSEYKLSTSALNTPFADLSGDLKKGAYRRDYYRTDFFEDKSPESMGQLKWIKGPYIARLMYKFNANNFSYGEERNDNQELEIKPGFVFNVNGLQLTDTALPLYLDSFVRLESLSKDITNSDNSITNYSSERLALRSVLSTKYNLFDIFNFEFYGGFDETGYSNLYFQPAISGKKGLLDVKGTRLDLDLRSHTSQNINRFTGVYGGSLSVEARKFFNLQSNWFNLNGLMHRVVPKVEFFGSSKPNRNPYELPQFDILDTFKKDDYFLLSLKNFFDIQRKGNWVNFLQLDAWAKFNLDRQNEESWEHITTELQFRPTENFLLRTNFRFRPGEGLNRSISAITYQWPEIASITVAERWENDYPWQTDVNLKLNIGDRYSIETGFSYLTKKSPVGTQNRDKFTEYYLSIQRKFHEILISLEYHQDRLFDEQSIGLSIRLF